MCTAQQHKGLCGYSYGVSTHGKKTKRERLSTRVIASCLKRGENLHIYLDVMCPSLSVRAGAEYLGLLQCHFTLE